MKTKRITYIGPSRPGVYVPDAKEFCDHGESIEVDAALADVLARQSDNWKVAAPAKKPE